MKITGVIKNGKYAGEVYLGKKLVMVGLMYY